MAVEVPVQSQGEVVFPATLHARIVEVEMAVACRQLPSAIGLAECRTHELPVLVTARPTPEHPAAFNIPATESYIGMVLPVDGGSHPFHLGRERADLIGHFQPETIDPTDVAEFARIHKIDFGRFGLGIRFEFHAASRLLAHERNAHVQQLVSRVDGGEGVACTDAIALVVVNGRSERHHREGIMLAVPAEPDTQMAGRHEAGGRQRAFDRHGVLGTGQIVEAERNLELTRGNVARPPAFVCQDQVLDRVLEFSAFGSGEVVAGLEGPVVVEIDLEVQLGAADDSVAVQRPRVGVGGGVVQIQAARWHDLGCHGLP